MAGVPVKTLQRLVAPATDVARVIPLPSVARREGITPVHPPSAAAVALFDFWADGVADGKAFEAFSASTATIRATGARTRHLRRDQRAVSERARAGRTFEHVSLGLQLILDRLNANDRRVRRRDARGSRAAAAAQRNHRFAGSGELAVPAGGGRRPSLGDEAHARRCAGQRSVACVAQAVERDGADPRPGARGRLG